MHCELASEVVKPPECEALRRTVTDNRKDLLKVDKVLLDTRYVETGFLHLFCEGVRTTLLESNIAVLRDMFQRLGRSEVHSMTRD